jgi:hypothetical protein
MSLVQRRVTGWTAEGSEFDSQQGHSTASRATLGPTQPSILWIPQGAKRPEREAVQSSLSSAKVQNAWKYTSNAPYAFIAWCLIKERDNFYLLQCRIDLP